MKTPRQELSNAGNSVLKGKTILVTRPEGQSAEFVAFLKSAGARVLELPVINISDPADWNDFDETMIHFDTYDAVAFTSANAVDYFIKRFPAARMNSLRSKKIFVVGNKTKESAERRNLPAEVLSKEFNSRDLGEKIAAILDAPKKILFPHGNLGKHELAGILRAAGHQVKELVVYQTIDPGVEEIEVLKNLLIRNPVDICTFFSPSSIRSLLNIVPGSMVKSSVIAVIGPTTRSAAKEQGLPVHITAEKPSARDLAEAIKAYYIKPGDRKKA